MKGLDNLLLKRLSVRMFSQSLFTFLKKSSDGWMELCYEGDAFFISILYMYIYILYICMYIYCCTIYWNQQWTIMKK